MSLYEKKNTAIRLAQKRWPLKKPFGISRGARTYQDALEVTLAYGQYVGRGAATGLHYLGETPETMAVQLRALGSSSELNRLPPGGARHALDAALLDLEAKRTGVPVYSALGLPAPQPVETAYTISLADAGRMEKDAREEAHRPLLKIKLGAADGLDMERAAAVRSAAPKARLIADANCAWTAETTELWQAQLAQLGYEMLEQPLPQGEDGMLSTFMHALPICADESCNGVEDVVGLKDRYDAVNIKLDKTGGLTEALKLLAAAKACGFDIMLGCMVGSSLSVAPAMLIAGAARWVDLDGPLLLAEDDDPPLKSDGSLLYPPEPELWG